MARILSFHSFRGGTGKSNISANVAALFAQKGCNVGVIDADMMSPGIHVLFRLGEADVNYSLNDYLWGRCTIQQAAYDVTPASLEAAGGRIFLIPSSVKAGEIVRILRAGYDVGLLNDGIQALIESLGLDFLIIDTHPGLNEETLLSIAISDAVVIIMRPDQQDYQGTGVAVDVARELEVPLLRIVVNKVPQVFNSEEVRSLVEHTYQCEVLTVLPHSDDLMALASSDIFVLRYPDHPVTESLRRIATAIVP
jgi:MinD-like ATPase involved in chromosome partitioning or flagellar assembly